MEVVFGKGKGVVIEEIIEDDEHPPWSSESMNEKRNKRWSEELWFRIQLVENDFVFGLDLSQDLIDMTNEHKWLEGDLETWNDDDDLLQQKDPYDWQQDPYMEMMKLKRTQSVDAPVVAVEEQLEKIEHVVDEEIKRLRKRKRENKDESASANVLPFGKIKQEDKVKSSEKDEKAMKDYGLGFHV
nr:hypothetical protein [Tanacetum cinerariifolium]